MAEGDLLYVNGRLMPRGEARISPLDRGFLYGDGFFETTRIHAGWPFFLDRHLARLAGSCLEAGFGRAPDAGPLAAAVGRLIEANCVREGYLRITVSRGLHEGRLTALEAAAPTVVAEARAMELAPLDAAPAVTLARSEHRRDERSPVVRHKSLSYQMSILALAEAQRLGADEVYFLNSRDELAEGATTNLFWVRKGVVSTPDVACGLLPGVTREVVLEVCRDEGLPAETGRYAEEALLGADEAFVTNSLRGVVPVGRVLGATEWGAAPGEVTRRLQGAYAALAERRD